ncbi:hypothetical protein LUZ60_009805 [Juncus effusus]|nr:hypothetical protein LUZ60_009805 [Juncus effusus]
MAEVALTALEWVASPIIEKLVQKAITFLGTDIAKELEDLETTIIPQFKLVIKAAENSPHKQTVAKWLRRLKNAYYEIEDILDELEYQRLESEVKAKSTCKEASGKATTSKGACSCCFYKPFAKMCDKVNKKFSLLSPTQRKLRNQLKNLRKVAEESKSLCELLKIQPNNANQTPTSFKVPAPSASIPLNKVIGRDRERDAVIDLLVKERVGERNPAIAITGIGGAGKTTLAQLIFNDQRVKNHFNVRIWVCLSPKLDVIKHTKEMIQSASMKCPQLDSLDALQRTIIDTLLDSKNTLLVLDDIWYNGPTEEEEWCQLLAPFTHHAGEHRIIFTSRSKNLPTALGPINHSDFTFKEIEANDFKALFRYFAFCGDKSRQTRELEKIGDKIAKKLSGSPLAAKAVASRLSRNLDYGFWRNTLNNVNLSDITKSLLWTYQRLDAELQRCFSYCSIFPKAYLFTDFILVNLWVSENFLECPDKTNNVTEKAIGYFDELIACSFFQPVSTNQLGAVEYKIHDLFHDLAEELSKEDCFRIKGSTQIEIPSTVRHISISVSDLKEYIPIILKSDQVRTVLFLRPFVNDVNEIFEELLSKLTKLRVLVLVFYNNILLPELVGELKHLRYLKVSESSILEFPESLSKLYHLEMLLFNEGVKKLPKNFTNLRKLRQVLMFDINRKPVAELPPIANIGKLTSLETVRTFYVREENGFELCQLGNLKRIKGVLSIWNLENGNKAHAIEAKLCEKKDIERLLLVWSDWDESRSDLDLDVIEALQPHENLKHLSLKNYSAAKYPNWLLENSVTRNLYSLILDGCFHLTVLPSKLTHCDELVLSMLPNLRDLSLMPERLTRLKIKNCPALVFAPKQELQLSNHDLNLNESEFLAYCSNMTCHSTISEENRDLFRPDVVLRRDYMLLNATLLLRKKKYSKHLETLTRWIEGEKQAQRWIEGEQAQFLKIFRWIEGKVGEQAQYLETLARWRGGERVLDEHAMQTWWHCHQQRLDYVYREWVNAPEFMLPSSLITLVLVGCNITDGALSHCLRRLTALSELELGSIMTLTTLPSEHAMRQLKSLKFLSIFHCWCLRSLGFLQGLVSLEKLSICYCPCLDIKHTRDGTTFPTSLQLLGLECCVIPDGMFPCDMPYLYELNVARCRGSKSLSIGMLSSLRKLMLSDCPDLIPDGMFPCDMPYLYELNVARCRGLKSLSIGMLTSLRKLILLDCPDLCKVEGLRSLPSLTHLGLINLPNFQAGSLLETPVDLGWMRLEISSLEMLKMLSAINAFAGLKDLHVKECQEETFTFEGLSHIPSLSHLCFEDCKINFLPNSLKILSGLETLWFLNCPEISSIPELPESIIGIAITKCPVLRERCCAPGGADWPKICHIPHKLFED